MSMYHILKKFKNISILKIIYKKMSRYNNFYKKFMKKKTYLNWIWIFRPKQK